MKAYAWLGITVVAAVVGGVCVHAREANAQAVAQAVSYGTLDAPAFDPRRDPSASGAITQVELSRGYPDASSVPNVPGDRWYVILWVGGRRAAMISANFDQATRVYDLIVSRKVKTVRCTMKTTWSNFAGICNIDDSTVRLLQ